VVNHFADTPTAGGKRQVIYASHLLPKGADVKVIDRRCPSSRNDWGILFFLPPGILHAVNNHLVCHNAVDASSILAAF
jgi:hypothetical protein